MSEEGDRVRDIGLDVHRDFCEVAIAEAGAVRSAGRSDTTPEAVELFAAGYKKAIELQVYDEYTAKIREALGRLAAQKYPPERESRTRERIGDRPPVPELVTEIVR